MKDNKRIAIIGAGFGGLSVAHHLKKKGINNFKVFEATEYTGGLARSFNWHSIDCDLAPHRLFTQNKELLKEMLELTPCHKVVRRSRICLSGKWVADPINAIELLFSVSLKKAVYLVFTYLSARLRRCDKGESFHSFVEARYGSGLNKIFFKPYAEKLFGIPSTEISANWGKSKVRISGLKDMLKRDTKLYFDHFYYPNKGGYGAFVEALTENVRDQTFLQHRLKKLYYNKSDQNYDLHFFISEGQHHTEQFDVVINTIPISTLQKAMGVEPKLKYRGANLVYLLIDKPQVMKQQWVYFVDRGYPINRMAEFKNFAYGYTVQKTVLCAEVTDTNNFSVERVVNQLVDLNMVKREHVIETKVIKIANAYPVYDLNYTAQQAQAEAAFRDFKNFYAVGRQAKFRHQDIDEIFASGKDVAENISQKYFN